MGTRAQIHIIDENNLTFINLYHHFDGYPDGVGFELYEYMQKHKKENNGAFDWDEFIRGIIAIDSAYGKYEFTTLLHTDIDYYYKVYPTTGEIKCYCGTLLSKDEPNLADPADVLGFDFLVSEEYNLKELWNKHHSAEEQ